MFFSRSIVSRVAGLLLLAAGAGRAVVGIPTIAIVSGDGQLVGSGFIGVTPMLVVVRDGAGAPVPNVTVTWTVTQGPGTAVATPPNGVTCSTKVTDANGQNCHAFFGGSVILPTTFTQTVITATYGSSSVTFRQTTASVSNNVVEAQTLITSPISGQVLTGPSGTPGSIPITIRVVGIFGTQSAQGVPHVALTIKQSDPNNPSSISCAGGTVFTDPKGNAICTPVFGGKVGVIGNFDVVVGGAQVRTFQFHVLVGPPAVFKIIAGDQQSGIPGQVLNQQLVAEVQDAGGDTLQGISVVFEPVVPGSVTLSNILSPSNAEGRVAATVKLGSVAGTNQVRLRTTNGQVFVLFNLTVNLTIAGLSKVSGDGQSGVVTNTQFPNPLVVMVTDAHQPTPNPVDGQTVSFAVTQGTALLGTPSAVTGAPGQAHGQAATLVLAGASPGPIVITASIVGVSGTLTVTFNLSSRLPGPVCQPGATFFNAVGGQANSLSPGSMVTIICSGLAPGIQGSVIGAYGRPLPYQLAGVTVKWGASPARLSPIYNVSNLTSSGGSEFLTVQVPFEVTPGPNVPVTITVGNGQAELTAKVSETAPAVFEWLNPPDTKKRAVMLRPDGTLVTIDNPAHPGDIIRAYVTGLIAPASLATGEGTPLDGEIDVTTPVIVGVNNGGVRVVKVSYAENLTGVWEVQFEVPADTATGNDAPFAVVVVGTDGAVYFSQPSRMPIQ
jgi:uncharacterized protein (TIGR03437 family)